MKTSGYKINELLQRDNLSSTVRRQLQQIARQNQVPGPVAHVEPIVEHEPMETQEGQGYDRPVIVRVLERRHRLPDRDGSSFKYLLDAIVSARILRDDKREIVTGIEKVEIKISGDEPEETVVEIWKA